jgi:hypothetical protein
MNIFPFPIKMVLTTLANYNINQKSCNVPITKSGLHDHKTYRMICRSVIDGSVCTSGNITVGNNCSNAENPVEQIFSGLTSCKYAHCASDAIDCKLEKLPHKAQKEIMTARNFLSKK